MVGARGCEEGKREVRARRGELLTTASCSSSSSWCSSAAVKGRGCLMGTPDSSTVPWGAVPGRCGLKGGNGWIVACGCEVGTEPLTAVAPSGSGAGFMDESWDARREEGWEVVVGGFGWLLPVLEGVVAAAAWARWGEGGTEFRSGVMAGRSRVRGLLREFGLRWKIVVVRGEGRGRGTRDLVWDPGRLHSMTRRRDACRPTRSQSVPLPAFRAVSSKRHITPTGHSTNNIGDAA